tara:strand:- start:299 stop:565 length:267 start_codon:yes stop_codon:yes gene_type:complete
MFVLTDKKSGGIYSVLNRDDHKTVQCFEEEDDCRRYLELLIANGTEHELLVLEVEDETIEISCGSHGYRYMVIPPNELVVPPPKLLPD